MMKRRKQYRAVSIMVSVALCISSFSMQSFQAIAKESVETDENTVQENITTVKINTVNDLIHLSEKSIYDDYTRNKVFVLENDLDLTDIDFEPISIFAGTFEGNKHSITGLSLSKTGSDIGFFRFVEAGANINNLKIEGCIQPAGTMTNIGGIAGTNRGNISGCIFGGNIIAKDATGGIAGCNEESGHIINCCNNAEIIGTKRTGGIAGFNEGTITGCTNRGLVNATTETISDLTEEEDDEFSYSVSFDKDDIIENLEDENKINYIGGITGISEGTVETCSNYATIGYEHMGYKIGGIVGLQKGIINKCNNYGMISGRKDIGGIVGQFEPYVEVVYNEDTTDKLRTQMDDLVDLMDELSDISEDANDTTIEDMDAVSDSFKGLKDSIRNYKDYYKDKTRNFSDIIDTKMDNISNKVDDLDIDIDDEEASDAVTALKSDIQKAAGIIIQLKAMESAKQQETLQQLSDYLQQIEEALGGGTTEQTITKYIIQEDVTLPEGEVFDNTESETESGTESGAENGTESGTESETEGGTESETESGTEGGTESGTGSETENVTESGTGAESGDDAAVHTNNAEDMQEAEYARNSQTSGPDSNTTVTQLLNALEPILADMVYQLGILQQVAEDTGDEVDDFKDDLEDIQDLSDDLRSYIKTNRKSFQDDMDATDIDITAQSDTLSNQMDRLSDNMKEANADIRAQADLISDQMHAINDTISEGLDLLDEKLNRDPDEDIFEDLSDTDDMTPTIGKILTCRNEGEVISDINGGGIAGTMEIDADVENDFEIEFIGDKSLDSDKTETATIINCFNYSDIIVKNDYAGGIVGRSDVGAVISCQNYGNIETTDGDYAGGIAGKSKYLVRNNYSLCEVTGNDYIGGIAGQGKDISYNYVMAGIVSDNGEKTGTIAGDIDDEDDDDEGDEAGFIEDNYFVDEGIAAINGLTYAEQTRAITYEELLAMKETPREFHSFTVKFMVNNILLKKINCNYGDHISKNQYPEIPDENGKSGVWEEVDLTNIKRNMTVHVNYSSWTTTIASEETLPVLLVSGDFYADTTLQYREANKELLPPLPHYEALAAYEISCKSAYGVDVDVVKIRVLADKYNDKTTIAVLKNNRLTPVETARDGRYLVFYMDKEGTFVMVEPQTNSTAAIIISCIILIAIGIILLHKYKKRKLNIKDIDQDIVI